MVYIPDEWEAISSAKGYRILARGMIGKSKEFWGMTDPVKSCQRIGNTYFFYFSNGLVFECPPKAKGVSDKTIAVFDAMKEEDGSLHICDPELVLLEKGQVYKA